MGFGIAIHLICGRCGRVVTTRIEILLNYYGHCSFPAFIIRKYTKKKVLSNYILWSVSAEIGMAIAATGTCYA